MSCDENARARGDQGLIHEKWDELLRDGRR
jgi:hypothetical protein